jgi:deferrochelatase/peroxidase EfeB
MADDTGRPLTTDRRRLLLGLGAGVGGVLASGLARAGTADTQHFVADAPSDDATGERVDWLGVHQAGIVTPRPVTGMIAAFDVLARTPDDLARLFRTLTDRIAFLTQGGPVPELDPRFPPADSGLLGPVVTPANLTITIGVGESLFDDRFGLTAVRPARLQRMEQFRNDALDARLCHGDLSLQMCANTPDVYIHALRDIIKQLPDLLLLRWKQEGSVPPVAPTPGPPPSARNFLGFRDGTANPDSTDGALMDELVWTRGAPVEPAWAEGGSYQAVRIIRNFVERWDRTPLREQERIFGRRKASGAPMDGTVEHDEPDYPADPKGVVTPLDSHIRLANARSPAHLRSRILRRGFNYSNGVAQNGQLDQGLLFICYQADLAAGFIAIQNRLNGEALEEYIKPVGGGYFFALPGVPEAGSYLGAGLIQAARGITPARADSSFRKTSPRKTGD